MIFGSFFVPFLILLLSYLSKKTIDELFKELYCPSLCIWITVRAICIGLVQLQHRGRGSVWVKSESCDIPGVGFLPARAFFFGASSWPGSIPLILSLAFLLCEFRLMMMIVCDDLGGWRFLKGPLLECNSLVILSFGSQNLVLFRYSTANFFGGDWVVRFLWVLGKGGAKSDAELSSGI